MDFDRAKIYEVSTSNIAHAGYETLNTNTPWDTEECEEWLEGSIQNHTKKITVSISVQDKTPCDHDHFLNRRQVRL